MGKVSTSFAQSALTFPLNFSWNQFPRGLISSEGHLESLFLMINTYNCWTFYLFRFSLNSFLPSTQWVSSEALSECYVGVLLPHLEMVWIFYCHQTARLSRCTLIYCTLVAKVANCITHFVPPRLQYSYERFGNTW